MAIYNITKETILEVPQSSFQINGLLEREHLQKLIRDKIEIISEDTLIISEEFADWGGSRKRIDLLGIDKDANLVVIELKRTETGDHMELQAIRYASMISTMSFEECISIYQRYLINRQINEDAKDKLMSFLDWNSELEEDFASDVKIVLASADFSKELTTSVMWLLDKGVDIKCVKITPYDFNGQILVDVDQIIPLPEAESYLIRIKGKSAERQSAIQSKRDRTKYLFNGKSLGKGRLVYEIVCVYTKNNQHLTYDELKQKFPNRLQGSSIGVIEKLDDIKQNYQNGKKKRHFLDNEDILVTVDEVQFAVSTEWGLANIGAMIELARNEGYNIEEGNI
ncbi:endonuclease NucS domain-containing protein [Myroides odoratus]|uniref:endonuclease NucS domain-containing protein n=1 Tax=Myroides odoratus TaxID=256 RepID=UPI000766011E|nr:endonuclease NucS domain-containing protein [Myroides odoratus]